MFKNVQKFRRKFGYPFLKFWIRYIVSI